MQMDVSSGAFDSVGYALEVVPEHALGTPFGPHIVEIAHEELHFVVVTCLRTRGIFGRA